MSGGVSMNSRERRELSYLVSELQGNFTTTKEVHWVLEALLNIFPSITESSFFETNLEI